MLVFKVGHDIMSINILTKFGEDGTGNVQLGEQTTIVDSAHPSKMFLYVPSRWAYNYSNPSRCIIPIFSIIIFLRLILSNLNGLDHLEFYPIIM